MTNTAPGAPILTAEHLAKSFGLTPALKNASLTLQAGESLAIMGRSGSGKSTLLHCLAGIQVADSGEVHYLGKRIDQLSDARRAEMRRKEFGFVFQFGQLVGELTARENVALPLLLAKMRRRAAFALAGQWLDRLGLSVQEADRRPAELSGGQAQRVAVARALAFSPKVIFADE
ncbi:MAG: ABC transporter ATP-binding protein, partial [Angustibacter sp.]